MVAVNDFHQSGNGDYDMSYGGGGERGVLQGSVQYGQQLGTVGQKRLNCFCADNRQQVQGKLSNLNDY